MNTSGFWLLDKEEGVTSRKLADQVARKLKLKKVGHTGTLDPLATGLMILASDNACKVQHIITSHSKEYDATIHLGAYSETDDREGIIHTIENAPIPTLAKIQNTLFSFVGEQQQIPPAHSAIQINGCRAYIMARQGEKFEIAPRTIQIYSIQLQVYEYPILKIHIHCGSGTYIRSLARDIGLRLHSNAYLQALRRTKIDHWDIKNAHTLEKITIENKLSLEQVLSPFARIDMPQEMLFKIKNGQYISWSMLNIESIPQQTEPLFIWIDNSVIAIAKWNEHYIASKKLLIS